MFIDSSPDRCAARSITLQGRGDRKSIVAAFTDIDIENQFIKWKTHQQPLIYDVSVNPKGSVYWYWSCVVSIACFYNLTFITLLVFEDIRDGFYSQWITGNIICDVIYLVDMWFQSRMFYYEHGCKVSDMSETRRNYFAGTRFTLDVISILPTDLFLFLQFDASVFRLNRLLKCYRLFELFDLAQGRLKQQTCEYRQIFVDEEREAHLVDLLRYWENRTIDLSFPTFTKAYVLSMYWSALTMTTLGEQAFGRDGRWFVLGSDFIRNLHAEFQRRVLKYCEHEMVKQEKMTEMEMRECLPPKLYTRINKYMQWSILVHSQLFSGCELALLKDLVARLEPMDFGPGDAMYIVASGNLKITDHSGVTLKTFCEGDIVEDRSIVWLPNNRFMNRRKHNVVSVGYSQVYILFRDDLLEVLKDYPDCREKIRIHAEWLQTEAGEVTEDDVVTDMDIFEGSTLEERLIALRGVICVLENNVNENYEKFKVLRRRTFCWNVSIKVYTPRQRVSCRGVWRSFSSVCTVKSGFCVAACATRCWRARRCFR
ncbi:hypothetical protein GCK32_011539 [Trichostrongylus colubriformis]|uniref:Cyclic nucleotide-binding domain-containing protein n=1 Tax=Trichostrongylus colubriformis TaxID=6319 RepID=A0AAN8IHU6_TRICO